MPRAFFLKSREEMVGLLMQLGFSQRIAERNVDEFLAYVGGTTGQIPVDSDRKDSVSEQGLWNRFINTLHGPSS